MVSLGDLVWACSHMYFNLNEIFPIPVLMEVAIWVNSKSGKKNLSWTEWSVAAELKIARNSHNLYAEY